MADTKISALSAATALGGTETLPVVQSGVTVKATPAQIATYVLASPTVTGHPTVEGVTATGATGTGKMVFDTSPTFVTPLLGIPTSGTLTNCTGLPAAGVTGTAAVLNAANTFTAGQRGAFSTLTDGATVAVDLSLANQYILAIGGNRTLGTPTNIVAGQQGIIVVRQDTTGTRTLAYAWPYEWAGGTAGVLSTPGCSRDAIAYSVDAYASATVTITIATPGVVTHTSHGLLTGQRCQIATTGALPTGLAITTTYFISVVDANSYKLCTTLANAAAGTFITTSGTQSGVHTLTACSISMSLAKAFA